MHDRLHLLAAAFRDVPLKVGAKQLRRPTAGTVATLSALGNPLFADEGAVDPAMDDFLALAQFVWMHTAPIEEVLAAAEDRAAARLAARRVQLEIDFEELGELWEMFAAVKARLEAVMVEPIQEGGGDGQAGKPTPTGSPPTCTGSVEPATPERNTGSSGSSRSSEDSNTSTPPKSPREESSDGRSGNAGESGDVIPLGSSPG